MAASHYLAATSVRVSVLVGVLPNPEEFAEGKHEEQKRSA